MGSSLTPTRRLFAFGALDIAVVLEILGRGQPDHCGRGEWWQEVWVLGVPLFVAAAIITCVCVPPRRVEWGITVPAAVVLLIWFVMFTDLAGACAD
jgi:hypothetical protein